MSKSRSALFSVLVGLAGSILLLVQSPAARAQGGPTVKVTAPTNGANLTNPVTITVVTSGALIKAATDNDPNAAHLHYFVDRDPATVVKQGQPIPTGQPDIIHTPDTSEQMPTLSPGQHTVWVVLAHTDHTPYNPNVQDQVSFSVGGGVVAQASPQPQIPVTGRGGLLGPTESRHSGLVGRIGTLGGGSLSLAFPDGMALAFLLSAAIVLRRARGGRAGRS